MTDASNPNQAQRDSSHGRDLSRQPGTESKVNADLKKSRVNSFLRSWEGRSTPIILGLILTFSSILGVVCIIQFRNSPFFQLPIIDEESYVEWGKKIAEGEILGNTIFYQDPLYPYFLGLVFSAAGTNFLLVRLLQVLLGTLSVAVVFWMGKKLLGEKPALAAAGIMALYHGLYYFELQFLKEILVILFSAVSCALGVAAADKPSSPRRWIGLGLSLGLLTLLRGNFQAILPFLVIWAFIYAWEDPWRERLLRAAAVSLGLALVIAPVTVRNHAVGGEWVLTTSQGGANFYIGNNPLADGSYAKFSFVRPNPQWEGADFRGEAEKRAGRPLTPSEVSRFWYREAFAWIRANPGQAGRLWLHKARLMIHQFEIPDNHSLYVIRQLFVPALWLAIWGFGSLWGPGLIGLWVMARRNPRAWYPALFALLYALSMIPFFIVDRYRVAVVPALAVFTAGFGVWIIQQWKQSRRGRLALAASGLALSFAIGFWPTRESQNPPGYDYCILADAYFNTGHFEEALTWYNRSIPLLSQPDIVIQKRAEAIRAIFGGDISAILQEAQRPNTTSARLADLGQQAEKLGEPNLAAVLYEWAAFKDTNNFSAPARLGLLYCNSPQMKNFAKGISSLRKALAINPHDLETMDALGNCYFQVGDTLSARAQWETILKVQPAHLAANRNLKLLWSRAKK